MVNDRFIDEERVNEFIDNLIFDEIYKKRKCLLELINLFLQEDKSLTDFEVLKYYVLQYKNVRAAKQRSGDYDYPDSIVYADRLSLVRYVIDEYKDKIANDYVDDFNDDYGDTDVIDYTQKGKKIRKLNKCFFD